MKNFNNIYFETKKAKLAKEQTSNEFKNVYSPIFFTDCVIDDLTVCSIIELLPILNHLAFEHNLNLSKDFNKVKEILIKSVKCN